MRKSANSRAEHDGRNGFSFLGILIVLVIIFLLAGYYFHGGNSDRPGYGDYLKQSQQQAATYPIVKGRAQGVVEQENLRQLQLSVNMWLERNPGKRCTIEALRADPTVTVPQAPAGYRYEIDENNQAVLVEVTPTNTGGVPVSPTNP